MEQARNDAGAEAADAVVLDAIASAPGVSHLVEQPEEVALADAVAAEHSDALAVPEFEIERIGEPLDRQRLADHRPLAGARPA